MTLRLALLGDSIGYGTGAAGVQDTLAHRLTAAPDDAGHRTDAVFAAVPGSCSEHLAEQVRRALPRRPDVVVAVVGAHDLTHLVSSDRADPGLLAADRFHPASAGYDVNARALAPPVLGAAAARRTAA